MRKNQPGIGVRCKQMNAACRIWEIDFARGIAIILMVLFHAVVDLTDFYSAGIDYLEGFWYFEGKIAAILFILAAGISSTLSRNNLKRGLLIFAWGMLLTIVTYIYNPQKFIVFGILHFLGLSMIIYHFMRDIKKRTVLLLSLVVILGGFVFADISLETSYFFVAGLTSNSFCSLDYYPVFPWLGVFLIGALAGKTLYIHRKSLLPSSAKPNFINFLGRHSLFIYLIHQPIILTGLYLLGKF